VGKQETLTETPPQLESEDPPMSSPTLRRQKLSAAELLTFRAMLEEQRDFRLDQLAALRRPLARHRLGAGNREISVVLTVGAETALHEVEAALRRMQDGSYGACVTCGGSIDVERLEILPQTPECMSCQATSA
jgi:RNA polymerase-binding transcription factor DksA